jgi:hypothetical protein
MHFMFIRRSRRHTAFDASAADIRLDFLSLLGVFAACVVYYGSYIGGGFNFADDGHFAQVAAEFMHGADPHAIRFGYGIAWFKVGEAMFRVVGPSYLAVQIFFYAVLSAGAGLIWLIVARMTGSRLWGLAAAAPMIAVPAFPPTCFYAFATLLNAWLLLRLAAEWRAPSVSAVAWAAAGLALTFQIRPDFGLVFAGVFAVLLAPTLFGPDRRRGGALLGLATVVFVLCHVPLLLDGAWRGYLDLIWSEYARYPEMLVRYVLTGSPVAKPVGGETPAGAGTLLARPPVAALWGDSAALRELATLIYAPALVLGFCLLRSVWIWVTADGDRAAVDRAVLLTTLTAAAAASFPHYFIFRPDLAHVANFMPGLTALVAVFVADLLWRRDGGRTRLRWVGLFAAAALSAPTLVYVKVGLSQPGTGSIAADYGRDRRFVTPYGVDVRVSADEAVVLEGLRSLVEAHSRPGDPIVCVPFCPGVAFMTGRRMFFGEFFVDDAMLLLDPGWIDRAVDRTRREKPGIVIVFDWSIHGTEISRFGVWANRYVAFLRDDGYVLTPTPGATAWVRPASLR